MENETMETTTEKILQATTLAVIQVLGLILNITVLVVFVNSKSLRASGHNVFVMNLIACDFIFLVSVMPISLVDVICPEEVCASVLRNGFLCQITGYITTFHCMMAAYTLAVIAIDRYVAVVRSGKQQYSDNKKPWIISLFFVWMLAALTASPPLLFPDNAQYKYDSGTKHCSPLLKSNCWFFWFAATNGIGAVTPTMTFCYIGIVREVRRQRRKVLGINKVSKQQTSTTDVTSPYIIAEGLKSRDQSEIIVENKQKTQSQSSRNKLDREVAKRGAVMVMAYLLCWSPYTLVHACPVRLLGPLWMEVTSMWIAYTLTIWNPIIYVFNNRQFKEELKKLLKRKKQLCC